MIHDQALILEMLHHFSQHWDPEEPCKIHNKGLLPRERCEYDKQGRLISLHFCEVWKPKSWLRFWDYREHLIQVEFSYLGRFSALQRLYLSSNQLSTLPKEVGNLPALRWLDLSNNQLSTLPKEVGKLSGLLFLYLQFNQLRMLPKEVGKLTRLSELDLHDNQLRTLPKEIGKLTRLSKLDLHDNQLRTLPKEIGKLSALQSLDLSYNQLTTLPAELGNLSALQSLNLSYNQFSSLPKELSNLPALQVLDLHGNPLSRLPVNVWSLSALKVLDLHDDQLSTLPAEVGKLSTLQLLNLSYNRLTTLPAELGNLPALRWLDLSNNQLSTLPAEVGKLAALRELNLSNNQLSALPAELSNLSKLITLQLDNNPLQTPPPEIIRQGIPAILAYLRTLQQATVERFEAKVILVGEGGMGKTSLLRALQQLPFVEGRPPTHGIEVDSLRIPHPSRSGKDITLHTWDFGGQEIYQATHQFFLTQRSVYLLVWNARLGGEACRLTFWLETITAQAPDAKILLVATHSDLWPTPTINLDAYRQRYPQIVGLCTLSNKTRQGLDELKVQIAATAVEIAFVGQQWPKTWVETEEALLAYPEHHLDQAAFIMTCLQHQIEDETERETFGLLTPAYN